MNHGKSSSFWGDRRESHVAAGPSVRLGLTMESKKDLGKSAQGMSAPKQYIHTLCLVKFVWKNSNFDMNWGAHTLGHISPTFFTFRLLDFRFLCIW
jgi:hypothetical protein